MLNQSCWSSCIQKILNTFRISICKAILCHSNGVLVCYSGVKNMYEYIDKKYRLLHGRFDFEESRKCNVERCLAISNICYQSNESDIIHDPNIRETESGSRVTRYLVEGECLHNEYDEHSSQVTSREHVEELPDEYVRNVQSYVDSPNIGIEKIDTRATWEAELEHNQSPQLRYPNRTISSKNVRRQNRLNTI